MPVLHEFGRICYFFIVYFYRYFRGVLSAGFTARVLPPAKICVLLLNSNKDIGTINKQHNSTLQFIRTLF